MTEATNPDGDLRRIRSDLEHISVGIQAFAEKHRPHVTPEDRIWAAITLCLDRHTCRSVLQGRPVLARNLDGVILHNALRGARRPDPRSHIHVTDDMLNAIVEAGPPAL